MTTKTKPTRGKRALARESLNKSLQGVRFTTPKAQPITTIIADGLDASMDGRGWGAEHERARKLADAAPEMFKLIEQLAKQSKDGECSECLKDGDEPNSDCKNHEALWLESDDQVEDLHGFISDARTLLASDACPGCENGTEGHDEQCKAAYLAATQQMLTVKGGERRELSDLSPDTVRRIALAALRFGFPWLGKDVSVNGGDTVDQLNALHDGLKDGSVTITLKPATAPKRKPAKAKKPPKKLQCPNCKEDRIDAFNVVADTIIERGVNSYSSSQCVIEASGLVDEYDNEESETNDRLECTQCGHGFPIPEGVRVDYV